MLKVWNECEQEKVVKNNAVLSLVSNSNIMKDFVFEERVKKLEELNKDERIKMVWMWCKQNVITLNQFKQLISYCG